MADKNNTRITVDIPTVDHKKLKLLAAFYGKSMREVFIELIERGLEQYQEVSSNEIPNLTTQKAIERVRTNKNLKKATSVEDLFKKLSE